MTAVINKKRCSSSEGDDFNVDILSEILFRLPHKLLARLKTVCRSWRSLIKSPQFCQAYERINKHNNPPQFLVIDLVGLRTINLYRSDHHRFTLTKPAVPFPGHYNCLVSSSCGLVCISDGCWSKALAVFNPTTNEFFHLPHLPHPLLAFWLLPEEEPEEEDDDDDYVGLKYWETRYLNVVSIGYHPPTNQYKIVQMLRDPAGRVARYYVLTVSVRSGTCYWRAVEESLMCQARIDQPVGCIDGVIYWENFTFAGESVDIICFDVGTEKLKLVRTPWSCASSHPSQPMRHLVELENKLCFVKTGCNNSYNVAELHMDIWMLMKGDNVGDLKSWTHMHRLELGPCPRNHLLTAYFPLCVDRHNNQILFYDRVNYEDRLMYAYHLNDKILKKYDEDELYSDFEIPLIYSLMSRGYNCVLHTEALVSLD